MATTFPNGTKLIWSQIYRCRSLGNPGQPAEISPASGTQSVEQRPWKSLSHSQNEQTQARERKKSAAKALVCILLSQKGQSVTGTGCLQPLRADGHGALGLGTRLLPVGCAINSAASHHKVSVSHPHPELGLYAPSHPPFIFILVLLCCWQHRHRASRPATADPTATCLSIPLGPAPPLLVLVPLELSLSPGAPQTPPLCLKSPRLLLCSLLREKEQHVSPSTTTTTAWPTPCRGATATAGEPGPRAGDRSLELRRRKGHCLCVLVGGSSWRTSLRCKGVKMRERLQWFNDLIEKKASRIEFETIIKH